MRIGNVTHIRPSNGTPQAQTAIPGTHLAPLSSSENTESEYEYDDEDREDMEESCEEEADEDDPDASDSESVNGLDEVASQHHSALSTLQAHAKHVSAQVQAQAKQAQAGQHQHQHFGGLQGQRPHPWADRSRQADERSQALTNDA